MVLRVVTGWSRVEEEKKLREKKVEDSNKIVLRVVTGQSKNVTDITCVSQGDQPQQKGGAPRHHRQRLH